MWSKEKSFAMSLKRYNKYRNFDRDQYLFTKWCTCLIFPKSAWSRSCVWPVLTFFLRVLFFSSRFGAIFHAFDQSKETWKMFFFVRIFLFFGFYFIFKFSAQYVWLSKSSYIWCLRCFGWNPLTFGNVTPFWKYKV